MSTFSNFAISFSIISILAGGFTSYWIGATFGGPLVVTLGWMIVGGFSLYWSAWPWARSARRIRRPAVCTSGRRSSRRKNAPVWSWFTGWFNFIGQIGVIASVDYALANYVVRFVNMYADVDAEGPPSRSSRRRRATCSSCSC